MNNTLSGIDKFRLPRAFTLESALPLQDCAQRLREIEGSHSQMGIMKIQRKTAVNCAGDQCTFDIEMLRRYSSQGKSAGRTSQGATNNASGTLQPDPATGATRIQGVALFGFGGYLRTLMAAFAMLIFWLISVLATGIAQNTGALVVWTLVAIVFPGIFWCQLLSDRQTLLRMIAEAVK